MTPNEAERLLGYEPSSPDDWTLAEAYAHVERLEAEVKRLRKDVEKQYKLKLSVNKQNIELGVKVLRLREWAHWHMCEDRLDSYGAEIWDHREDGQPIPKPDCGECIPCQARKAKAVTLEDMESAVKKISEMDGKVPG